MINDIFRKRREIIVLILSFLVISFLVSGLASYTVMKLGISNDIMIWIISSFVILIGIFTIYYLLVASLRNNRFQIVVPITFDRINKRFVDLPFCPFSVNARVAFDQLSSENKTHLASYTNSNHIGTDLERFINCLIQNIVLTRVIFRPHQANMRFNKIKKVDLPEGIKENQILTDWIAELDNNDRVRIPDFKSFESYGRNNSWFKIRTKGGKIDIAWVSSYMQVSYYSKAFISTKPDSDFDYCDYILKIYFSRTCNVLKLFSKKATSFNEWIDIVEDNLRNHDWKESQADRIIYLLHKINLSNKFSD